MMDISTLPLWHVPNDVSTEHLEVVISGMTKRWPG